VYPTLVDALFTVVRGICILRTSPFGYSQKFALKEFSEVCQKVPNLVHLGDAPVPSESMLQVLRGERNLA
jgi:hypothetical protein